MSETKDEAGALRDALCKHLAATMQWVDLGERRRLHSIVGAFAAEVEQSSDGKWFAEIGLADKRDPYWMRVILGSIRRWSDSVATADEAKRWAVESIVGLMLPISTARKAGER